jgi:hypothetical protein
MGRASVFPPYRVQFFLRKTIDIDFLLLLRLCFPILIIVVKMFFSCQFLRMSWGFLVIMKHIRDVYYIILYLTTE